ncbi:MAG: DNA mismatch endonuclease Vsr [Acetobacteraceae bacterium]
MDTLSPRERSRRMAMIRDRDTKPEMIVRRLVHGLGYRYRLGGAGLPGRPDLVFPSRRSVIMVHGCFWHHHADPHCRLGRVPKSRLDFWLPKLERNRLRDMDNEARLENGKWRALTIWECELRNLDMVTERVLGFLGPAGGGEAERADIGRTVRGSRGPGHGAVARRLRASSRDRMGSLGV